MRLTDYNLIIELLASELGQKPRKSANVRNVRVFPRYTLYIKILAKTGSVSGLAREPLSLLHWRIGAVGRLVATPGALGATQVKSRPECVGGSI